MKHKKLSIAGIVILTVFALLLIGLKLWLRPSRSTSLSLAVNSTEKVSEPFHYSGYSSAAYRGYTKTSEYVEMEDGVRLAVDIYLPANGPEDDPGVYPVVFQYTPYGRAFIIPEKTDLFTQIKMKIGVGTAENVLDRANSHDTMYGSTDATVQTLLSYGYAYVCADCRGMGASFGTKVDFMPQFATDGKQLVDWIAGQPWSDGNVGMFGGSYLGFTQLVTAGQQPEALKAIFPEVTAFDGYSTEIRPGGIFCTLYSETDYYMTQLEQNNYLPDDYVYPSAPVIDEDGDGELWDEIPLDLDGDGEFLDDYRYPEDPNDEPRYPDGNKRAHIYYLATLEHVGNTPYSAIGDMAEFIDQENDYGAMIGSTEEMVLSAYDVGPDASVPAIMDSGIAIYNHGSWMDCFTTSTVELYCTMQSTNPSRMIIDPGYHETWSPFWEYCGEDEDASVAAYAIELVRFYDRYLKGIENGIDTEPPIYLYNMNGDGWRFEREFPLSRQQETSFYFAQDGFLASDKAAVSPGTDLYAVDLTQDSSYVKAGDDYKVSRFMMEDPDEVPDRTEEDKKCLSYTTSPFTEDTEITGVPIFDFYVSSTSDDADFHVYLEDVDEAGKAVLVTEGLLRAGFAALYDNDSMILAGSTGVDVLPELPWHGYEQAQYNGAIFSDGNIVELTAEFYPTSWTVKQGHSLRISIACADTPTFETNPAVDEDTVVTLYRDEAHPSRVILPVIPR